MEYSIGEMAAITGLTITTLRYYDKEGLLPTVRRTPGGIRVFTDFEIGTIKVIECLKATGLTIEDIRQYMRWHEEGDATLQQRHDLFHERLAVAKVQMEALKRTMAMIQYKCWYYDTALRDGSEAPVKAKSTDELPAEVRQWMSEF